MNPTIQILCEGYHDRAFWKGFWLKQPGCVEHRYQGSKPIKSGKYGYLLDKTLIIVSPCTGKTGVRRILGAELDILSQIETDVFIVNIDSDGDIYDLNSCRDMIRRELAVRSLSFEEDTESFRLEQVVIKPIVWGTSRPLKPGVPQQQTLERMVCTALSEVYPERAQSVARFLEDEPVGQVVGSKHHAWSYMAKWAAERGCDDFYASLWEDEQVSRMLIEMMKETGAWRVVEDVIKK